jgi:hypothetical protein
MSRGVVLLFAFVVILVLNDRANAAGAVAVGIAPGGVIKGYGYGFQGNSPNMDEAKAKALGACKTSPSNPATQARCKVVATFTNKCVAGALDPKNGTPGAGWALGDTQKQADDEALARCRSTAGDRREFCKVINQLCDGTAK